MSPAVANEVERYLRTGDTDPHYSAWSGDRCHESRPPRAGRPTTLGLRGFDRHLAE